MSCAGGLLAKKLKFYGLDGTLFFHKSKLFGDFHIYEDMKDKDKHFLKEQASSNITISRATVSLVKRFSGSKWYYF